MERNISLYAGHLDQKQSFGCKDTPLVICPLLFNLFPLLAQELMTYITINITSLLNECEILGVCIIHTYYIWITYTIRHDLLANFMVLLFMPFLSVVLLLSSFWSFMWLGFQSKISIISCLAHINQICSYWSVLDFITIRILNPKHS